MTEQSLIYRCGGRLHALPLAHVLEVMRPLPIDTAMEETPLLRGSSIIRGKATPVLDLAPLLGTEAATPTRLINVRAGPQRFAFLADAVLGIAEQPRAAAPFLDRLDNDMAAIVARLDGGLRTILEAIRELPEQVDG